CRPSSSGTVAPGAPHGAHSEAKRPLTTQSSQETSMRKLGLLLSLVIVLVLAMVSPAAAAAADQSGTGMNRQGGPSTHPGNGWKDPGQDQGSPANTADPDCTGNRTSAPQRTNVGACDTPTGAADKPGGHGGFDADRDWNNGCGNDTDFEDDNNGQCHGPLEVK